MLIQTTDVLNVKKIAGCLFTVKLEQALEFRHDSSGVIVFRHRDTGEVVIRKTSKLRTEFTSIKRDVFKKFELLTSRKTLGSDVEVLHFETIDSKQFERVWEKVARHFKESKNTIH